MKQYYVNVEGDVFALVKKEVAKCIFKKDKGMTVFLIFSQWRYGCRYK